MTEQSGAENVAEQPSGAPAPAAGAEQAAAAPSSSGAEQETAGAEQASAGGEQPAWQMRRIGQLTRRAAEAERRAALAEARLQQLAQEAAAGAPQEAGAQSAQSARPAQGRSDAEFQMHLQAAVAEREFNATCNRIYAEGVDAFPDFRARLDTLAAAGAVVPEVVLVANEVGDAHRLLAALADEPELAERLPQMTPAKMAVELQKLRERINRPKAPSKAPPPPETIRPGGVAETDPSKMTVAEYVKWRKASKKNAA